MPELSVKHHNFHKLTRSNILITILGSLLIFTVYIMYLGSSYRNNQFYTREQMQVLTSTAASRIEVLFGSMLITMKLMNEWIVNNPDKDPRFDPEFIHMVDVFREYTNNRIDLRMVSEDGGLFYIPSKSPEPLANVSDREYYLALKGAKPENLYFAGPVQSRVTGRWGIPVSFHLAPNAHSLLTIFAVIEYRVFDELYADLLTNHDRAVNIVRADNTLLARSPVIESRIGEKLDYSPTEIQNGEIVVFRPDKVRRMITYQKLNVYPVYIVVSESTDLVIKEWLRRALLQTFFAIVVFATFLLINMRQFRLIVENRNIQLKLEAAARYDSLTGLKNRRYFFERAADEMERTRRTDGKLSMLIADIDFFKTVNDSYGHPAGDAVLKKIAGIIDDTVRSTDLCGRIGGEEFGILLVDADISSALETAERIRVAVSPVAYNDWHGGLSIGAAEWKVHAEDLDHLIKRTDQALYVAKNTGRNRVVAAED